MITWPFLSFILGLKAILRYGVPVNFEISSLILWAACLPSFLAISKAVITAFFLWLSDNDLLSNIVLEIPLSDGSADSNHFIIAFRSSVFILLINFASGKLFKPCPLPLKASEAALAMSSSN